MDELNNLELKLLSGLTDKYPSLKFHIPYLTVSERKPTGVGLYVNFTYLNSDLKIDAELNALYSNGEHIELPNLENGLSYVIDITDGEIKYIEFTTYGENWDGVTTDYKL